jgi:hypothetical protein
VSKVLLVPVEPVLKPRRKAIIRIGNKEFCAYIDTVQLGAGYVSFVDCDNNYRVVPVYPPQMQFSR